MKTGLLPFLPRARARVVHPHFRCVRPRQNPPRPPPIPAARPASSSPARKTGGQRREPRRREPPQRPDRHGPHERRGAAQLFGDDLHKRTIARISRRDQNIAHEARGADPLHGVARKQDPKAALIKAKQRFEPRRTEFFARLELQFPRGSGEFVPRADREAIVAAIDAIADGRAEFFRDMALVLDGEVGDAAPRVEHVGLRERLCRADVEAGPAGAAMIALGRVARQRQRGEDRAKKQPGAEVARDEIGVLALPAKARRLRQRLLHDRRGIDEHLDLGRVEALIAGGGRELSRELLQAAFDDLVIIAVAGVDRDVARAFVGESRQRIAGRRVIRPEHHDADRLRPEFAGIGAARLSRGKPVHVSGRARGEPGGKAFAGAFDGGRRGDPANVETKLQRLRPKRAQKSRSA